MIKARIISQRHINDSEAYKALLKNSSRPVLYAQPWYLSVAAQDNWAAIVFFQEHKPEQWLAVMPFCFKKVLGILKVVYMPPLVQQLGVFFHQDLSKEERVACIELGIQQLKRIAFRVYYCFNEDNFLLCNELQGYNFKTMINQVIEGTEASSSPWENISSTKRKHIKRAAKQDFYYAQVNSQEVVEHFKNFTGHKIEAFKSAEYNRVVQLLKAIEKNSELKLFLVYSSESAFLANQKPLLSLAWALLGNNTVVHLFGGPSYEGKLTYVQDIVIHNKLQELAESNSVFYFDFEGSNLEGVQRYNEAFGAKIKHYSFYYFSRF